MELTRIEREVTLQSPIERVDRAKSHGENVQGWKGAFESLAAYAVRDASRVAS